MSIHSSFPGARKLQELNERMVLMPRAEDFQIPYSNGRYFPDHSRVQAKEHRNVMQILPHILHGLDEHCCDIACRFEELLHHGLKHHVVHTLNILGYCAGSLNCTWSATARTDPLTSMSMRFLLWISTSMRFMNPFSAQWRPTCPVVALSSNTTNKCT